MNIKTGALILTTVLPSVLLAGQNGLTSDILTRANSLKADPAAFEMSTAGRDGLLRATAVNETLSLVDTRTAQASGKFSSVVTRTTNEPSSLNAALSSGVNAATRITNEPSGLDASVSSGVNAVTRTTNEPSSLNAALSSGANVATRITNEPPSLNAALSSGANAATRMTNEPSSLNAPEQLHSSD